MKKLFVLMIVISIGIGTNAYAQKGKQKSPTTTKSDSTKTNNSVKTKSVKKTTVAADESATVSSLCTAQEEVIEEVLDSLYAGVDGIDVIKTYETSMTPRIGTCLKFDMIETGIKVQNNALEGKFKKIKLRFEKPSDNTFKISGQVKRKYKHAYKLFKKSFVNDRKNKPLDDVLSDDNLSKKVNKVSEALTHEFKKNVRKISK